LDYPKDKYEIIVVDDGSTDHSAGIAKKYPVRLIRLKANRGRIIARNVGAQAAKNEILMFNDARVVPEKKILERANMLTYQPLIPIVFSYDGARGGFKRLFHLLRCKIYSPSYQVSEESVDHFITQENFDKAPKGTTNLICDRKLWLESQPMTQSKYINDDTRILRRIVETKPILRTSRISVYYSQRTGPRQVFLHIFERGPRFADYYLRPGGKYFPIYILLLFIFITLSVMTFLYPLKGILIGCFSLITAYVLVAINISQFSSDFLVVMIYFPIIFFAFGLGILKWQIMELLRFIIHRIN
jgi:glycosyltransferase involved in cell wall biosynthesis